MASPLSDEEVLAQIAVARSRAKNAAATEVRAKSAWYDPQTQRVVVELTNGAMFAFPSDQGQGLRGASAKDLASVELSPSGLGLHWDKLDADLYVPALLQGMFGTKEWMRQLGRAGGAVCSEAKAQAARRNGCKGGRPRKTGPCANVPVCGPGQKPDPK
jgi:hypothetical protein